MTLSTTPVYVDGRLEPRPASLRVYLARTAEGWIVMPGGFARVGSPRDTTAHRHAARRPGGRRLGGQPDAGRAARRCCPASATGFTRSVPGSLPSRAAENLIWLGRYVERSEGTARILRAYHARLAETSDPDLPLLADMRDYLEPLGIDADAAIPPGAGLDLRQRRLQRRPDPRPLLARRLAGAARPVEDRPQIRRARWRRATTRRAP